MKAVLYLRSSKDRAEMSLDAQRAELQSLASRRGLEIVGQYEDAVYSGMTDDRPGFQALLGEIRNRGRGFDHILIYDTSRIARDQLIAQVFKRECEKRGIRILYATLPPDLDPITGLVLHAVYEAFDQMHSMTSRQKGVAGMRQNVLKGWRAGGRAPLGYRLAHESTGAIRDGKPVLKSKLEPAEDAGLVGRYLSARAAGRPRTATARELGMSTSATTLVSVEWNALLYAGHTVWNVHADKKARGAGQRKRRDRAQWVIQRDTHPALITDVEAETILAQLETSEMAKSVRAARAATSTYLLAGILETDDGRPWLGYRGHHYRLKPCAGARGRYVSRQAVEDAVIARVREDVMSPAFLERLVELASQRRRPNAPPRSDLDRQIQKREREAERAADLAVRTEDPTPFLALVDRKRREAEALRRQMAAERAAATTVQPGGLTLDRLRPFLDSDDTARAAVREFVARAEMTQDCRIRLHYRLSSLAMVSPRNSVAQAAYEDHSPAMASPGLSVGQADYLVSEWFSVAA